MHEINRSKGADRKSAKSVQEGADQPDDLELLEIGRDKLVLTKVGADEIQGKKQVNFEDLSIVGMELTLEGPAKPDHDPYNNYIINRGDMWYRVSRRKDG